MLMVLALNKIPDAGRTNDGGGLSSCCKSEGEVTMKTDRLDLISTLPVGVSHTANAVRNHGIRRLAGILGLCAGLVLSNAQAAFQLVEDFDSLTLGNINGQNSWFDTDNSGQVVVDPDGGTNQALVVNTESAVLHRALTVPQDTSRMLFLRFRFQEHGAYSFGLSPMSNPVEYADFGAELGMAAATTGDPNNELRAANGSTVNVYDVLETLTPSTWYNVWVRVNTSSSTYEVWLNADPGGGADSTDQLDNDAAETVFGFRTIGAGELLNFFIKTGGGTSPVDGRFYLDDIYLEDTDAVNLSNPAGTPSDTASLVAASLPSSRSVQVGNTASAFATMINTSSTAATDCSIAPQTSVAADFTYQTTDASNVPVGTPDTPVDIAAGESQSFVFGFLPTAPISPTEVLMSYDCTNSAAAPVTVGVNTLLLSASATPVPDIVALAATQSGDGIVDLPGTNGVNAFAVATVNVGATGTITASAVPSVTLPLVLSICETNAATGACLSGPASSTTSSVSAGATPTYSIFVTGNGTVPFDPAANRIFVEFRDGGGLIRGSTSVAVRTQ
jgi:hypothetical protein